MVGEERRSGDMERQIEKVASNGAVLTARFVGMTDLMDERWKSMEKRLEINASQERQSIELLTTALTKLQANQETASNQIAEVRRDHTGLRAEFNDWRRIFENSQSNVKTWLTLLGGGFLTTIGTIIA